MSNIKRKTLLIWLAAALVGQSGCGLFDRNTSIASAIIQKNLSSPSSYSTVYSKTVWSGENTKGNPAHIVRIEFDADNLFGATVRECRMIGFYTEGEAYYWDPKFGVQSCVVKGRYVETKLVETMIDYNFKK